MSCNARFEGSPFGVKRPLRFLSEVLVLSEAQHTRVAEVLAALKTEREQAAVHTRRSTAMLSDAFSAVPYDATGVEAALRLRAEGETALRDALAHALKGLHAVLDPQQRTSFAHLLRTGQLVM
jgi:hypothetical protein